MHRFRAEHTGAVKQGHATDDADVSYIAVMPSVDAGTAENLLEFANQNSAALTGLECQAALARLDQRHDELIAALEWLLDHGRINEAMRLATELTTFWRVSAKLAQGSAWCERILATAGGDDVHRGRLAYEAGMLFFWMGNDAKA